MEKSSDKTRGLTAQQEVFCREYLKDLNGTQAAIRANYAPKSAFVAASRLLRNDKVASRLAELMQERSERIQVSADDVIKELKRIAFASMGDLAYWNQSGLTFKPSDELTEDQLASVLEVSESTNQHGGQLRIRQHDKIRAIELLGKHLGIFTDNVNVKHGGEVATVTRVTLKLPDNGSEAPNE